jgi:hypothetical protein
MLTQITICSSTDTGHSASQPPVSGGLRTCYEATTGEGALLVVDGLVTQAQAKPVSDMCDWLDANAQRIEQSDPDIRSQDLWIVTDTFSAKKRPFALLRTKDDRVSLAVDADAAGVGKAGATIEWWKSAKDVAWNVFKDVSCQTGSATTVLPSILIPHHSRTALSSHSTEFVTAGTGTRLSRGLTESVEQNSWVAMTVTAVH